MKKLIVIAIIILSLFLLVMINDHRKYGIFDDVEYNSKYPDANREMFLSFLTKVQTNENSKVALTTYTDEGDSVFYVIDYDGEVFNLIIDTRQDAFGEQKIYKRKYEGIEERTEHTNGTISFDYVLVNEEDEFSLKSLLNGW